jgi:hypothetical protein
LTPQRFNLNGLWRTSEIASGDIPASGDLRIDQRGDDIQYGIAGHPALFKGKYLTNPIIAGQGLTQNASTHQPQWVEMKILIDDPDHIRLHDPAHPQNTASLFRTSAARPDDAVCDAANSAHTRAHYAYQRGKAAVESKQPDYSTGVCWFEIGASNGDAESQAYLAPAFRGRQRSGS